MHHLINLAIAVGVFIFAYIYASIISVNPTEEIILYYKSYGETPFNQPALVQQVLMIVFLIQWAVYIPAFILKTEKFYDLTGSITYIFVIYVVMNMVGGHSSGGMLGNVILGLAIILWALRLGSFLFLRIQKDGEDKRFRTIKTSFSQFFMTWTLQGLWVFICSSAAIIAMTSPTGVIVNNIFYIGLGVFILGFTIEIIADHQKSAFRSNPSNKDAFIVVGLWGRSRHPNYFGEITLWTGISIMSVSSFVGWNYLALISPAFVYVLLVHISGVRMLEARGEKKWGSTEEYKEYKKNTPKLIPKIFT